MENLLEEMGRRLADRRKQLRMMQEEVAEKADLTCQTISTAETGRKALRPENIVKLCRALNISTDYLLLDSTTNDISLLTAKIASLSPDEYRHLEDIVNSYIAAVRHDK